MAIQLLVPQRFATNNPTTTNTITINNKDRNDITMSIINVIIEASIIPNIFIVTKVEEAAAG